MKVRRLKLHKMNEKGSTLLEVMVTFALLGIFLLAAVTAASASMKVFYRMQRTEYGIMTADTILNKIDGELSMASKQLSIGTVKETPGAAFYTSEGNPVYISVDGNGYFVMHYYEVKGTDGTTRFNAADWTFDKKMYNGFTITSLTFTLLENNTLEVEIRLKHDSFEYSAKRFIECINLNKASDTIKTNQIIDSYNF